MLQKRKPIRSQKLRDSARGEVCTLMFDDICNGNTDTTVLCHLPDRSHGMGRKSDDIFSVYGCSSCHDYLDGRTKTSLDHEIWGMAYEIHQAFKRTLSRMIEKGLVKIDGYKPD